MIVLVVRTWDDSNVDHDDKSGDDRDDEHDY